MDTQYAMDYQHNIPAHLLGPNDKTELAVFSFSLNDISAIGRSLIDHAIEHPWLYGIAAGLIVGGILFLVLPVIIGFGRYGPIAGKSFVASPPPFSANEMYTGRLAARWQGWIGTVVKGELFAILQKLAMNGVFKTIGEALIAAGIVVGGIGELLPPRRPISEAYYGGGMAGGVGTVAAMAAMWAMYFGV